MSKRKQPRTRGTLLTIALILVLINNAFFTIVTYSFRQQFGREFSPWYLGVLLLAALAGVIAAVAMWYWKRWGIYVYFVANIVAAAIILLQTGSSLMMFGSLIPSVLVAYIVMPRIKQFS